MSEDPRSNGMRTHRSAWLVVILVAGILALALCALLLPDLLLGTSYLIPAGFWPHGEDPYLQGARERVHPGYARTQAIAALSDAWYHADCAGIDLFFYGPKDPEEARIVYVRSVSRGAEPLVTEIGGVDNDTLRSFSSCLPAWLYEKGVPTSVPAR